jgi:hypothetical protein
MPYNEFYGETDWQATSGPILSRQFAWLNGAEGVLGVGDLWPVGQISCSDGATDKDDLDPGLHPFLAIGPKALRPLNLVGVVMTYNVNAGLANLNLAPGFAALTWVCNILGYNSQSHVANAWDASLDVGEPVYIDDSPEIAAGCTLSRSPANNLQAGNPRAGYTFYDQDDYADFGVGGPNLVDDWPKVLDNDDEDYVLVPVILWPDAF